MPEPALVLVRHAEVRADAAPPADQWPLTDDGRTAARALGETIRTAHPSVRNITASSEVKAVETASELAEALGATGPRPDVEVDHRLREVARPWTDDHTAYKPLVARYLTGEEPSGWEPRDAVAKRFSAAIDDLTERSPALAVSHGIAMTVWLASVFPDLDPIGFWTALGFPDAWLVHRDRGTLEHLAT